jgi:hypothetical protein
MNQFSGLAMGTDTDFNAYQDRLKADISPDVLEGG